MLKYRYHTRYVTCVSRSSASAGSKMGKLERVRLMRGCDCQKCKIIAKQQLYISECWTSDNWSMRETFYIFAAARPCFGVNDGKAVPELWTLHWSHPPEQWDSVLNMRPRHQSSHHINTGEHNSRTSSISTWAGNEPSRSFDNLRQL